MSEFMTPLGLSIKLEYVDANSDFNEKMGNLVRASYPFEEIIFTTLDKCNQDFQFDRLGLWIDFYESKLNPPPLACGGNADKEAIGFYFCINYPEFITISKKYLDSTIAHEFGHYARFILTGMEMNTLWDAVVHEGIAIHFQKAIFPNIIDPLTQGFSQEVLDRLTNDLINDRDKRHCGKTMIKWYSGEEGLPFGSIYPLADILVGKYLGYNPLSLKSLVELPSEAIEF